jgi:HEAT repeat protein
MKMVLYRILISIALLMLSSLVFAQSEEFKPYQSLLLKRSTYPSGHIIVQVPKGRKAPENWEMQWYVSTYTPKGYKLSLGVIEDKEHLGEESRLVFKVPIGEYKIEISRKSKEWTASRIGVFNITESIWQYSWPKTTKVADVNVSVKKGDIKIVNISYQNPQVLKGDEEEGKKTMLYMWENFGLLVEKGTPADLPKGKPVIYHIIKYAYFKKIDETHLVEALKKDENYVAVTALLNLEKPNAKLLLPALRDNSLKFDISVAMILVKSGDKSAVTSLINILKSGSESEQYMAAWTLGELKAKKAVEPLIAALKNTSIMLRNHAAYALAQIKDARAVDALIEATKDKGSLSGLLVLLAKPEIHITYFLDKNYKVVGPDLPIPSSQVRKNAIYALGQIGGEKAVNSLLSLLNDSDNNIQWQTIFALSNHKNSRTINAIIKKLNSDQQSVRWMAVQALGKMRAKKAVDILTEIAQKDPDKMCREAAQEAVDKIKKATNKKTPSKKLPGKKIR